MAKKGQITIFIILAILIVSAILVFFLYVRPTFISSGNKLDFENCVQQTVEKSILKLEKNAGFVNSEFTYNYKSEEFTYLCYTNEYYKTCTIQQPFLKQHFQQQIEKDVTQEINLCYENSLQDLKDRGYSVTSGKLNYSILINPSVVNVNIQSPTTVGSNKFSRFNVQIASPLYEMLMISTVILQYETFYGDADVDSIMSIYQDYYIEKIKRDDGTTIYILNSKSFENKFQFASKSLTWPAGYVG